MKITLLYQVSHYIRVKKQRNIKSWDQQNYLVITGFCYIGPLYNEVPLYPHFLCLYCTGMKRYWTPNPLQMCIFGHPILKSWLKPWAQVICNMYVLWICFQQVQPEKQINISCLWLGIIQFFIHTHFFILNISDFFTNSMYFKKHGSILVLFYKFIEKKKKKKLSCEWVLSTVPVVKS